MIRSIPAGDYVEHFDPELPHHRAWLLAVLEQLVAHEPEVLQEGGALSALWMADAGSQVAVASPVPVMPAFPNPLQGVPCFRQTESAQDSQRSRSCFSSSCAMLVEALRPGSLKGTNGDDQYLSVVQSYGDSTDANAQLQALAHFGVTARLEQNADFQLIEQQINRGIPVPCGYIHRGPVDRSTGWPLVGRCRPYPHPCGGERSLG